MDIYTEKSSSHQKIKTIDGLASPQAWFAVLIDLNYLNIILIFFPAIQFFL